MKRDDESRGPNVAILVVAVMLMLPPFYAASYVALVTPNGTRYYRWGGEWSKRIYWPLEEADRKMFPKRWPFDPFR